MEIYTITNVALLGYVPMVLYLAHLKTKFNMLKFKKEQWRQTALMLEKKRKEIANGKVYPN